MDRGAKSGQALREPGPAHGLFFCPFPRPSLPASARGQAGQSGGFARDWLVRQNADPQCFIGSRIPTRNTHGTGCTLSSAIAALYPHSKQLHLAVAAAKSYLHGAIDAGQHWHLGHGNGPVAHFWRTVR